LTGKESIPGPGQCASACLALGVHRSKDVSLLRLLEQAAIVHMRENKMTAQLLSRTSSAASQLHCNVLQYLQACPHAGVLLNYH
jgi:hypothetical protein